MVYFKYQMKCLFLRWTFTTLQGVFCLLQKEKYKEQEEEEEIGEDSQFMKLAKKVTAKSLQKKGKLTFYWSDNQTREKVQLLVSTCGLQGSENLCLVFLYQSKLKSSRTRKAEGIKVLKICSCKVGDNCMHLHHKTLYFFLKQML